MADRYGACYIGVSSSQRLAGIYSLEALPIFYSA
jgi:hypothetical protein